LRERVAAQQTAGKLAKAGVRFAFESGSLTNISDLLVNANRVIENGLSSADAVRAFTIWPAEILGVANQLGSIEAGKIANLTVTRGDLFDRNMRLAHVFIDGRPVDLRPATDRSAADRTAARTNVTGSWTLNINFGQGERAATLTLQQEGDRVTGSIAGVLGSGEISNASTTATGEVRFTVPLNIEGQTKEATFAGTLTGNEIRGSVTVVGSQPGTFIATRSGQPN
jgi:adenine deaminase